MNSEYKNPYLFELRRLKLYWPDTLISKFRSSMGVAIIERLLCRYFLYTVVVSRTAVGKITNCADHYSSQVRRSNMKPEALN